MIWHDMTNIEEQDISPSHWRSMFWADGWLFKMFSIQTVVQFRSKARPLRLTTWWRDPRPTLLGLRMFSCSRLGGEDLTILWSSPVATGFSGLLGADFGESLVCLGRFRPKSGTPSDFVSLIADMGWCCTFVGIWGSRIGPLFTGRPSPQQHTVPS